MHRRTRSLVLPGILLVAGGLHAWSAWSPGAPTYPLSAESLRLPLPERMRTPLEHDAVRAEQGEPYVLALDHPPGALLYYGARHADDPSDPQLADIRGRWEAFRPTVALCEGRSRGYFLGPLLRWLVGQPEPALVHELARKSELPLYSLEPDYAQEVALLLERHEPGAVALYFTLRVYWAESAGRADEGAAEELRRKRSNVDGLRTALPDLAAMDACWKAVGGSGDWRAWTGGMPGELARIDEDSRAVRGEHMLRVLIALVEAGERVFAVVGSGHVIRQEPVLRRALVAEPPPLGAGAVDTHAR